MNDKILYQKKFAGLLASFAILSLGVLCFLNNLSLDYYSVLFTLKIVIPAAIVLGLLGYAVGKIFDDFGHINRKNKYLFDKKNEEKNPYKLESMFSQESQDNSELIDEESDEDIQQT